MAHSNKGECSSQPEEAKVISYSPKDYDFGQLIHEGRFTKLYVVRHSTSKEEFVMKAILYNPETCEIPDEIMVLRRGGHPNIIKPVMYWSTGTHVVFMLPLMPYRSCADIVQDRFPSGITESSMGIILSHIIPAVEYMHEKRVVHRAIKGSHILINSHGMAVLCGFKHRTIFAVHTGYIHKASLSEFEYYMNWLSPEVIAQNGKGYSYASDVYSIGITALELCNGVVPYAGMSGDEMLNKKLMFGTPKLWDKSQLPSSSATTSTSTEGSELMTADKSYSTDFHTFISVCLVADAHTRPNITELKKLKFVEKYLAIACNLMDSFNLNEGLRFQETAGEYQKGKTLASDDDLCISWIFE